LTSSSSPPERRRRKRRTSARPRPPPELRAAGLRANKALGQHFLVDPRLLDRIADAGELSGDETVVEVGAGLGALTERLAARAGRVLAIELDADLVAYLEGRFAATANVTIVRADVLALDLQALVGDASYDAFGNLPYNIGTAILRRLLESARPPRRLTVMLQREVADAIVAGPGDMSLLSVSVQVYARARRLFRVAPSAFYPPPKVDSTVLRIEPLTLPPIGPAEREAFFAVVRAGFSAPRKQLRNTLAQGLGWPAERAAALLAAAGINPTLRPQTLALEQWLALHAAARALGS
jgi:16S rRNA (adenine1518-N6/adenine1519-N6)-dimethyltransferase